ncbi:ABC transporter ATP-binding protein [Aestuariibacter salexigens]|uniref:ABC transporter ATP-binding protein n=1 Tax=Aestuariibacter salexigens TaxID=226010 RepID=UPI00047AC97F|nr:ABC transporter ATP-binding protein [Aestuariibacter salexigens]
MLTADAVSIAYAEQTVVQDVSFALERGQIGCLLGPSGCGKTSLLKAISGFVDVQQGSITLRDTLVSAPHHNVAVEKRHVGMVFQDFALFPHLSVAENIGFGLRKLSATKRTQLIQQFAELVGLADALSCYPHQLSGGQQQRVAIARALAPEPDVLLMDEPFSSLDSELRKQLASDVRFILKQTGTTALMVTHDQHEAFAIADKVGVVQGGHLHQWDTPFVLYHQPATQFVAEFIGEGVFIDAVVRDNELITALGAFPLPEQMPDANNGYKLLVRPDDIRHVDSSAWKAKVINRAFRGANILYYLELQSTGNERVLCLAPSHHDHKNGEEVGITLDLEHLVVFPKQA